MLKVGIRLNEDMHVHSQFSDGKHTIERNAEIAVQRGVARLGCVDHVRRSTDWLPDFVRTVANRRSRGDIDLVCGVEAKILNASGTLDLPDDLSGIDKVYAADHQFPLPGGCQPPQNIREVMARGEQTAEELIFGLVETTRRVLERYPNVVLAHLFSVLPKVGLCEAQIPHEWLDSLARSARETNSIVEIDERWACPSARTLRHFMRHGVELVASSDSHRCETIAEYSYVLQVSEALRAEA